MALAKPLNGPYFKIDSRAYSEQVGSNRQARGKSGEIHRW